MKITKISMFTGVVNTMDLPVTQDQLDRWEAGEGYIQDVFPHLSIDQREFLISGTTPEEWDAYAPEDD